MLSEAWSFSSCYPDTAVSMRNGTQADCSLFRYSSARDCGSYQICFRTSPKNRCG